MDKELEIEKTHLQNVIIEYQSILADENLRLEVLPKMYKDNELLLMALMDQTRHRIHIMENNLEKPYFARLDFKEKNSRDFYQCYIGKVGVIDDDNQIITVDWRSPIASLYYDSNIGPASYLSPSGVITGDLLVKRQFEINQGKLINYQDVDTVSNDELLKPYLGVSADHRLKNIVSSIQQEQNDIIRKPIEEDLIVQGVAGSGKTTVALHRIAYLVYNNRSLINPDQYMVIGPNSFFLKYIESVLPDLDVTNVNQWTFEELVKKSSKVDFILLDEEEKSTSSNLLKKRKTTLEYKKALDKYLKEVQENLIPITDFCLKNYLIIPHQEIKKIYQEIDRDVYFNIESIIERMKIRMTKYIKDHREEIIDHIEKDWLKQFSQAKNKEEERKLIKAKEEILKEINKDTFSSLSTYFTSCQVKVRFLYQEFLKKLDNYLSLSESEKHERDKTLKYLNQKKIAFEDLAAILYIAYHRYDMSDYRKYRYIVIDEAQDWGEFHFYIVKKLFPQSHFSIFGDLAQSIYGNRSITNWQEVANIYHDAKEMYLLKSYRTTIEIMEEANKILKHLGLATATPVIRHGEKVHYIKEDNLIDQLKKLIQEEKDKGHQSIAIITRTNEDAKIIATKLNILCGILNDLSSEVNVLSSYLAKGLEFDAVILVNISNNCYDITNLLDMKLLYVAMTRALHDLCIIYQDNLIQELQK